MTAKTQSGFMVLALIALVGSPAYAIDEAAVAPSVEKDAASHRAALNDNRYFQRHDLDDKAILSVVLENDIFVGRDQYYTNGLRVSYLTPERRAPQWAQNVARHFPFTTKTNYRISMAFGQNLYVPRTIEDVNPSLNDRPYAGWLYGSLGVVSDNGEVLNTALLTLGIVGPSALGEQTQKLVHKITDSPRPMGWDYQLRDEPGVILTLERKWRNLYAISPLGLSMDITPHVGVNLGNVNTDASVGGTWRVGFDLPSDYGPPRIRPSMPGSDFFVPSEKLGGYFFVGAEGRGVGRNIFLDGNTFRESRDIDKNYWVGSLQSGVALTYKDVRMSFTHVFMTREFKKQDKPAQFAAVTMSVRF